MEALEHIKSAPPLLNDYDRQVLTYEEEFFTAGTSQAFGTANSGAAAIQQTTATVYGDRAGVLRIETGTDTTGRSNRRTSPTFAPTAFRKANYRHIGGAETLSTAGEEYSLLFGFFVDDDAIDVVSGMYALYERANAAAGGPNASNEHKLSFWTVQASTRTATLTDIPVVQIISGDGVTGWLDVEVEFENGVARIKQDGVIKATHATNIPSSTTAMWAGTRIKKSAGGTNRRWHIDHHRLTLVQNAARRP